MTAPRAKNIFSGVSARRGAEAFRTLFANRRVRIERIVSRFHASPPGFWYDQKDDEWVIVIGGRATLEFSGGKRVGMKEGDYLAIPRGMKHRVAKTGAKTVWLAVHVKSKSGS